MELLGSARQPVSSANRPLACRVHRIMSVTSPRRSGDSPWLQPSDRLITPLVALTAWAIAWFAGQLLGSVLLAVSGNDEAGDAPIIVVLVSVVILWLCYLVAMVHVSRRYGTGRFATDFGLSVRGRDVLGVGIGVLCQIVLVPALYLPLQAIWPDTFSDDRIQQNAAGLASRASGVTTILLILVVAIGAPIVEELVYRGLIQRSLTSRLNDAVAVVATAGLFTLIHFRPAEYPGLFVFSIVLGVCAAATRRLGFSIAVHVGFNATGLLLVMQ
jgi:membrane protease YdiL (CAAX protease family)